MPSSLPTRIRDYRVIASLGQGGMARARLAVRDGPRGFHELFVIKELRGDLAQDANYVDMFFDEARLAAMLLHPNVVQAHEVWHDEESCFISLDYLEGQSMARLWRRVDRSKVPLRVAVHILTELLAGLAYAHELVDYDGTRLNVVHRDVTPGNVLITYTGEVKLLDFGIAKAAGASSHTQVGVLKGKLSYMAPEQAQASEIDSRADIFAVGVLLWEAPAQRAFVSPTQPTAITITHRINGEWPVASEGRDDVPPELEQMCERAMAIDPEDRYASAQEFRRDLVRWLGDEPPAALRRDLAAIITEHFAKERDELRARIGKAMAGGPRFVDAAGVESSGSSLHRVESQSNASFVSVPAEEPSQCTTKYSITLQRRRQRQMLIGITMVGVLGCGATVLQLSRDPVTPPTVVASVSAPLASVVSALAPAPSELVTVEFRAAPNHAWFELDGQRLPTNPFRLEVPRDGLTHELRVAADDHLTVVRAVNFASDQQVDIALESLAVRRRAKTVARRRSARARARRIPTPQPDPAALEAPLLSADAAVGGSETLATSSAGSPPTPSAAPPPVPRALLAHDRQPVAAGDDLLELQRQTKPVKRRQIDATDPYDH